jgi:hypothetical protein
LRRSAQLFLKFAKALAGLRNPEFFYFNDIRLVKLRLGVHEGNFNEPGSPRPPVGGTSFALVPD